VLRRKCEKCGRDLVKHTTKVLILPMISDPDAKVNSVEMYHCRVCEKFKTEFAE